MALEFRCEKCNSIIIVQYLKPGEKAICRHCGTENIVPTDAAQTDKKPVYNETPPVFEKVSEEKKQNDFVEIDVPSKPEKPFPGIAQTLLLFLIYFIICIFIGFFLGIIGKIIDYPLHKDSLIMSLVAITAFALVLYLGYTRVKESFEKVFSLRVFKWLPLTMICIVLLGLRGCFVGIGSVAFKHNAYLRYFDDIIREDLFKIYEIGIVWSFLYIAIIAPVLEEMFFRGLLLRSYLKRYSAEAAIIITALLFGIMHGQYIMVFWGCILGLLLAWLYLLTRSLWPCILAHSFSNLTALIAYYVFYNPAFSSGKQIEQDIGAELVLIAAGTIMFVVGIVVLIKLTRKKPVTS